MAMKELITRKLKEHFSPISLEVIDESSLHAGHSGWREGQTTHVRIRLVSLSFSGMNRVAIHREINVLLAEEFAKGLHALAIEAKSA